MAEPLRLLCVLAHPDDESLGCGGVLAKYAAEGVETHLLTATLGERGRIDGERPGPQIAAPIRERELRAAAATLGVRGLHLLGYVDGELDAAEPRLAAARIAAHVRRIRPQVVVTFGAEGAYGHPDHVAVSRLTGAALVAAADGGFAPPAALADWPLHPHRVDKLYWMAWTGAALRAYQEATGSRLAVTVDGAPRRAVGWPKWALGTRVDAREHWRTVWAAIQCHRSQIAGYALAALPPERHEQLWGRPSFVRVWSLVNGGRERENDLFAGLRPS